MPKLWSETIDSHRHEVRDAILEATAALAAHRGPLSVTMSEVAKTAGIGRATLYKYFSGVDEILDAWHERQISQHLEQLREKASGDQPPLERVLAVLAAYAKQMHRRGGHGGGDHSIELACFLHRPDGAAAAAAGSIHDLIEQLIADAADRGEIRTDISATELTHYCLHALEAATHLRSRAALNRLVGLIRTGLES